MPTTSTPTNTWAGVGAASGRARKDVGRPINRQINKQQEQAQQQKQKKRESQGAIIFQRKSPHTIASAKKNDKRQEAPSRGRRAAGTHADRVVTRASR
jgi:hypothetical protein